VLLLISFLICSIGEESAPLPFSTAKPGWRYFTPKEAALLGTATDTEIAKRIGGHPSSIQAHRLKLGLGHGPGRKNRPWTPEKDTLPGTASDTEIAARIGRQDAT
jgi:hypothetical protein